MKKILTYVVIVFILGGVFGLAIHQSDSVKADSPLISSVLEFVSPQIAYADSDTIHAPAPPQPPPPIDK